MTVIAKSSGFGIDYLLLEDENGKLYSIYIVEGGNIDDLETVPTIPIEVYDRLIKENILKS